jgi:transcriptional regulator with XRE-family HTH domain
VAGVIRVPTTEKVGPAIRFARHLAGLTQAQLAERAGVAQPQVGMWERGLNEPRAGTLIKIFDALGYDLALIPREDPDA